MGKTSQLVFDVDVEEAPPGRFRQALSRIQEMTRLYQESGGLFTGAQAAEMLEVTRQRVYQMKDKNQIESVELEGKTFYTGQSLLAWMVQEKNKPGVKAPEMTPQKRVSLLRKAFSSE